jgi:hypothetical protein
LDCLSVIPADHLNRSIEVAILSNEKCAVFSHDYTPDQAGAERSQSPMDAGHRAVISGRLSALGYVKQVKIAFVHRSLGLLWIS